jgi:hypothetical protein
VVAIGPPATGEPMQKSRLGMHLLEQQGGIGATGEFLRQLDVNERPRRCIPVPDPSGNCLTRYRRAAGC